MGLASRGCAAWGAKPAGRARPVFAPTQAGDRVCPSWPPSARAHPGAPAAAT